jgi:hypothetical protein
LHFTVKTGAESRVPLREHRNVIEKKRRKEEASTLLTIQQSHSIPKRLQLQQERKKQVTKVLRCSPPPTVKFACSGRLVSRVVVVADNGSRRRWLNGPCTHTHYIYPQAGNGLLSTFPSLSRGTSTTAAVATV